MPVYDDEKTQQGDHDNLGVHPERREAEAEDWDSRFNAPAYGEDEKSFSDTELAAAEAEADEGDEGAVPEDEKTATNFVYNNKGANGLSRRGKKALWAGGAGGGITLLLILLLFFLVSQMKVFSFSNILTTASYARFGEMIKERWTGDLLDRSLIDGDGSIAPRSTLLDKFRLKDPNYRIAELGREGQLGFEYNEGRFDAFKVGDQTVSLDAITRELGVGEGFQDISSGIKRYTPENIRARAAVKKTFSDRANALKVHEVFASEKGVVRSRTFGYLADQAGFKFSRWRNAGREFFGKSVLDAASEDAANTSGEIAGEEASKSGISELDKFLEDSKNPENIKKLVKANDGNPAIQDRIMESYKGELAAGAKVQEIASTIGQVTLLLSIACMVNMAAAHTEEIRESNYQHAMNLSLRLSAAGNQAEAGDVTSEAYATEAAKLDSAELAPAYQYQTGQTNITYPDNFERPKLRVGISDNLVDLARNLTSPSRWATGGIAQIDLIDDNFCQKLLSPQGAVIALIGEAAVQVVLGILSAGTGTAASEGGALAGSRALLTGIFAGLKSFGTGLAKSIPTLVGIGLFGYGLELLAQYLGHSGFNGLSSGPNYYEEMAIGGQLVQDNQMRTMMGGAPIPDDDVNALDASALLGVRKQYANEPFFARMFSIKNPFSLTSSIVTRVPTTRTAIFGKIGSMFSGLASTVHTAINPFGGLLLAHAGAQTPSTYRLHEGFQAWGYTRAEMNLIRNDDSYGLIGNEKWFADTGINPDSDSKFNEFSKCFKPETTQYEADKMADTTCKNHPGLSGEEAFRYRIHLMDNFIADEMNTDLEDGSSGQTPPVGGGSSDLTGPCAPGTTDLGIPSDPDKTAYKEGKPVQVRLCALPNLKSTSAESQPGSAFYIEGANGNAIVNAVASYKFFPMISAAVSAGIPIAANSSFRTMAHQQSLCSANSNCSSGNKRRPVTVATPGSSNHQGGEAIDFGCPGAALTSGDQCFRWLSQNATQFSIKNYEVEPWHWSLNGQ